MRQILILTFILCNSIVIGQSRSGQTWYTPIMKWRHFTPLGSLVLPNQPTVSDVASAILNPDPKVEKYYDTNQAYQDFMKLDSTTQDSIKNLNHSFWTMERFKQSEAAIYSEMLQIHQRKSVKK